MVAEQSDSESYNRGLNAHGGLLCEISARLLTPSLRLGLLIFVAAVLEKFTRKQAPGSLRMDSRDFGSSPFAISA
jgi:hypothetical protein